MDSQETSSSTQNASSASIIIQAEFKSDLNTNKFELTNLSFEIQSDSPIHKIKNDNKDNVINNKDIKSETQSSMNETNNTSPVSESAEQTKSKIEIYTNALFHSAYCTSNSCSVTKCLQFKRLNQHNKSCKSFINDKCEYCKQLIAISVFHAKKCSNSNCLVPFCLIIKQKLEINKSIEFVNSCLNMLKYKIKKNQSIQTVQNENTNKRKYSSLEDEENLNSTVSVSSLSSLEENTNSEDENNDMKNLREQFFEKLKEIKEKKSNESKDSLSPNQIKLRKMCRDKIFSTFYQKIIAKNQRLNIRDGNYAKLMVLLLRKEAEFNSTFNPGDYLYLLSELFYNVENKLGKFKEFSYTETQTETCQFVENKETFENTMPMNKRIKIE